MDKNERTLKVTNIKRKGLMALERECLQKLEGLFFLKKAKGQKVPGCLVLMSVDWVCKKNRIKKITKNVCMGKNKSL